MMQDHLIGELSVWLERLQSASAGTASDLAWLRRLVESQPAAELPAETVQALALANRLCWDSLSRGDTAAFDRQAAIIADLRLFGVCARLLDEELTTAPPGASHLVLQRARAAGWAGQSGPCSGRRDPGAGRKEAPA